MEKTTTKTISIERCIFRELNPSLSLTGDDWETFMEGENPTAGPKMLE
jgi:hypothetical protein